MPDESSSRTGLEMGIGAILAVFTGWLGLRQKQAESRKAEIDIEDHEQDLHEKIRLDARIDKLESVLDAKDAQLELFRKQVEELSKEYLRLQLNMGKAISKCSNCEYCNCECNDCSPCKNKKPIGGEIQ